jgi:hypothetical protein
MKNEQGHGATNSTTTRPSTPYKRRLRPSSTTASASSSTSSFSWSLVQKFTLFLAAPCLLTIWKLSTIDFDAIISYNSSYEDQFFLPPNGTVSLSAAFTTRQQNTTANGTLSTKTRDTATVQDIVSTATAMNPVTTPTTTTGHVAWDAAFFRRWKTAQQSAVVDDNNDNINDRVYDEWYSRRIANATAVIAYATTITSCQANSAGHKYMDMAAVLAHSIHLSSIRNPNSTSTYDYQLYAFIHPDAMIASSSPSNNTSSPSSWCADQMHALGYIVQARDTPINVSLIKRQSYVDRLLNPNSGCCGAKEFLKFYSYTLTEHPIVVHVDLDVMIVQPLDELFHVMMRHGQQPDDDDASASAVDDRYIFEHAMWPEDRHLTTATIAANNSNATSTITNGENSTASRRRVVSAMFTRDYPMLPIKDGHTDKHVKVGVQGGFLMIRPNVTVFNELCQLILQGNFETGWYEVDPANPDKKKVHYPGFYGAAQVQGLLAFYYGHVNPNQTVELNRCVVNNMVDDPRVDDHRVDNNGSVCITGQADADCQDCRLFNISDIYTAHFTFCAKPSHCHQGMFSPQPLCYALHSEWHRIRYDLETVLLSSDDEVATPFHHLLDDDPKLRDFYGHCSKGGSYATMDWKNLASILNNLTIETNDER